LYKLIKTDSQHELSNTITQAKHNKEIRESFITQYIPFIDKTISRVSGRYITREDDEHSIGLIAFNEAIEAFDENKSASFFALAGTIIKRRLIDFYRKERKKRNELGLEQIEPHIAYEMTIENLEDKMDTRFEITYYTKILESYNIQFSDLVSCSPGNKRARQNAMDVVKVLVDEPELTEYLISKRTLPIQLLERKCKVSKKTIERQRKYIIAVAIIHIYKLESLLNYVSF